MIPGLLAAAVPTARGFMVEFRPFTLFHVITVIALLGASLVFALIGRKWRGTPREVMLGAFWGGLILARQGIEVVWYLLPANLDWSRSLPLQFCDVAPWFAAIALLTEKRWARALLYYWGIGLSTQAFFTPTLSEGFGYTRYWWFWLSHTHIIGTCLYDMIARGYRPTWGDWRIAFVVTFFYTVAMIVLDAITGLNYGYLGPTKPGFRTVIDALGPYPWRIPLMMLIVLVVFTLMTAVWRPGKRPNPA
ncbi:MAG: TIGR02206 family membrane protein [Phycisphaerales bacterium]|nr:TIGR02206 family membrane protein [Phycisphaerales bacterium]